MVIDPGHRYSNESEKAIEDIYDYFKLKKNHLVAMIFTNYFSALRVNQYDPQVTSLNREMYRRTTIMTNMTNQELTLSSLSTSITVFNLFY